MGLGSNDLDLLLRLKRDGFLEGARAVVEIGAQQLSNSFLRQSGMIEELGRLFGVQEPFAAPQVRDGGAWRGAYERLHPDAPRSRDFWAWLGFRYASIDIDGSPGAIPLDLNYDDAPARLRRRFTLAINAGTTEHVVNQLNAFKVIHDLTAVGGVMVHTVPSQGMVDHGLVNYNPKFFWMLARSNGYQEVFFDVLISPAAYAMPDFILDQARSFGPGTRPGLTETALRDGGLIFAFRKRFDRAFIPGLDVDTGAQTEHEALRRRYWPVFSPDDWRAIERRQRWRARARQLIDKVSPGVGIWRGIRGLFRRPG